eukprot:1539841-Amphidinium_carterae.1
MHAMLDSSSHMARHATAPREASSKGESKLATHSQPCTYRPKRSSIRNSLRQVKPEHISSVFIEQLTLCTCVFGSRAHSIGRKQRCCSYTRTTSALGTIILRFEGRLEEKSQRYRSVNGNVSAVPKVS